MNKKLVLLLNVKLKGGIRFNKKEISHRWGWNSEYLLRT